MATAPDKKSPETTDSEDAEVSLIMECPSTFHRIEACDGRVSDHEQDIDVRDHDTREHTPTENEGRVDTSTEVKKGIAAIFADPDNCKCRRRIVTKDDTERCSEDKVVSFSNEVMTIERSVIGGTGYNTKERVSPCSEHMTTKTGKAALETDADAGGNPDETSYTVTPRDGADGAPQMPSEGEKGQMLCMKCRCSFGREFVVPVKVNLLRCEAKLDELMQRVDVHYRRLSTSMQEIIVFEYALSHDGAADETMRRYGPLLLADRYDVNNCYNVNKSRNATIYTVLKLCVFF